VSILQFSTAEYFDGNMVVTCRNSNRKMQIPRMGIRPRSTTAEAYPSDTVVFTENMTPSIPLDMVSRGQLYYD